MSVGGEGDQGARGAGAHAQEGGHGEGRGAGQGPQGVDTPRHVAGTALQEVLGEEKIIIIDFCEFRKCHDTEERRHYIALHQHLIVKELSV